jgi:hypothetical protein
VSIFVGFLIAGLALGAAVWLPEGLKAETYPTVSTSVFRTPNTAHRKADWEDPLAVAGVGAGVALVAPALRRT